MHKIITGDPQVQLTLTLAQFVALHDVVLGHGAMSGAWHPIREAREELREKGFAPGLGRA